MSKNNWNDVDCYFERHLLVDDPILASTLEANTKAKLPAIDVTPNLGKLLYLLARIQSAKRILEIGTLGGYSTIWLARALQSGGKVITLELERKHAEVALANIKRAGLENQVEILVGQAVDSLKHLEQSGQEPFDFLFIDADKERLREYIEWALRLSRTGSVIVVDNVVRGGAVVDERSEDERVQGVRRMVEVLSTQSGVEATFVQTVGTKGHDGFILAYVR